MFCKNCGKELPDGVKFCNGCGAPVTPAPDSGFVPGAGQFPKTEPFSADDGFVPGAGQPQQPGGFSAPGGATKANPMAGVAAKLKGNKTGLIIVGVSAIALIAVIVLVVNLVGGLLGGGGSKNPMYAYLTDDYELMYLPSLSPDAEAVELTDEASYASSVQFAPDGKTLYFTDGNRTLYKITLAGLKKEEKPERIKRDVSTFRVLDDGRVLYREYDSGKLSVYDGEETFTLVKEYDSYQLSEDHKTVYFTEREDDNTLTLSRIAIDKDAKAEELLDGADVIYSAWDASTLVYGEGGIYAYYGYADGSDPNTLAIYACKPGEKAQKLIDDIYSITGFSMDGDKVSFYYWVQDKDERTLYDFVTDEKAGADAALIDAGQPASPSSYDYSPASYPNGLYIENGVIYCVDRKGDSYPVDTSALQAQQNLPPEELSYWDVLPLAQSECTARYEAAREEYEAAYEVWRAASNRESIRATLRDSDYTQISYELYHYDGAKPQDPIATDVNSTSSYGAPAAGIFLYKKANTTGGKVGDVADLESAYDIYELMESGGKDNDWYQNVGGKESVLDDIDPEAGITTVALLNKTELILRVSEDDETSLQSFTVSGDAIKLNDTIVDDDDDFSGVQMGVDSSGKDVLYLFTDVGENSRTGEPLGDFCVYRGGKLETIVKEIYGAIVLDDSGVTYVVTDIDREDNAELALLKDGKPVTISDEVSGRFIYFPDSTQALYTSDGDLYLWNGKEEVRIARDVLYVWLNTSESYSSYSPGY